MLIKTPGSTGEFGELSISQNGVTTCYPTYTCGHCTSIVVMRPDRQRPRLKCLFCGRIVCDNEICSPAASGCTPLYSLADDRFSCGTSQLVNRAKAIMRGATTLGEIERGL
jgi:hypothetical protein